MLLKSCIALLLVGLAVSLEQPGGSSNSQGGNGWSSRSLLNRYSDEDDDFQRDAGYRSRDEQGRNDPARPEEWVDTEEDDWDTGRQDARDVDSVDRFDEDEEDWNRQGRDARRYGEFDRADGFDRRDGFDGSDDWERMGARSDKAEMRLDSQSKPAGTTILFIAGAKIASYPLCGLDSKDQKCVDLFNSLFIPQQWGAVGRAFNYILNGRDYGLGCQNPGKCKVITNPFKSGSKAYRTFKPLDIVKLDQSVTISGGAKFPKTSQLQINAGKIQLQATWTFQSGSYLDVLKGAELDTGSGNGLQGRVELFRVIDGTLLVRKLCYLSGPVLITGSAVSQTAASVVFVDENPQPSSPNLVDIIQTTWSLKSSSLLTLGSRNVYVAKSRFTLENSELALVNTTMQFFDSSLFLTNALITLDETSSLTLYNYRIVGDVVLSDTDIPGIKPMIGQPLRSNTDFSVTGPGYISTRKS